jgi:hypothetical protein
VSGVIEKFEYWCIELDDKRIGTGMTMVLDEKTVGDGGELPAEKDSGEKVGGAAETS